MVPTPLPSVAGRHHQIPREYAPEENLLHAIADADNELLNSEYLSHLDQEDIVDLDRYIGSDNLEKYLKSLETNNDEPVRKELSPPAKTVVSSMVPAQIPISNALPSMAEWHSSSINEIPPMTAPANNGTSWLIPKAGSTAEKITTYGNVVVVSEVAARNDTTNIPQRQHIESRGSQFYQNLLGLAPSVPGPSFAGPGSIPQHPTTSSFIGSTIPSTHQQQITAAGYPQPNSSTVPLALATQQRDYPEVVPLPNISPPVTRSRSTTTRPVCLVCNVNFPSQFAARLHFEEQHVPGCSGIPVPYSSALRYHCHRCVDKRFRSNELLQAHIAAHKPYSCLAQDCPLGFSRRSSMMQHYRVHHVK